MFFQSSCQRELQTAHDDASMLVIILALKFVKDANARVGTWLWLAAAALATLWLADVLCSHPVIAAAASHVPFHALDKAHLAARFIAAYWVYNAVHAIATEVAMFGLAGLFATPLGPDPAPVDGSSLKWAVS